MRAPAGQLYLVYFGYTSCPDVCPTTLSDIRVALDDLPPDLAHRVTVAMATVDPERDTGPVLTQYLGHFFDRSIALREPDPTCFTAAADAFGVQWQVGAHRAGEPYDVSHTAITYVVDDTGTVAVEWPFGFDSRDMTADLTTLLEEEHP
jgi:protein SCO1/2